MASELPTFLIVDDDELVREFTVAAVNNLGYVAVGRADADEAMKLVSTTPSLQVLLSDVCLESGTGPDLVRKVLRSYPELKVIFMSGGFGDISFRRTDPLLNKPFSLHHLQSAIDSVLHLPQPGLTETPVAVERRRGYR